MCLVAERVAVVDFHAKERKERHVRSWRESWTGIQCVVCVMEIHGDYSSQIWFYKRLVGFGRRPIDSRFVILMYTRKKILL